MLCGTPLLVHPCRDATLSILYSRMPTKRQYIVVVTVEVFSALGLSLIIPNIGLVLNVLGTISNPIICFILPCMYYIKAFPGKFTRIDLLIAHIVLVLMTFIGIMGFILFWTELFGVSF